MIYMDERSIYIDGVEVGAKPSGVSPTRWGEIADKVNGLEDTITGLKAERKKVDESLEAIMDRIAKLLDG